MTKYRDLEFGEGEHWIIRFQATDAAGQPLDLTGGTVEFGVSSDLTRDPVFTANTVTGGISFVDPAVGRADIVLSPADHEDVTSGEYLYEVRTTTAASIMSIQLAGRLTIGDNIFGPDILPGGGGGGTFRSAYVASIAALRALTTDFTATIVSTLSYWEGTFIGEGDYRLDASDTTSADNNGTVIVDAAGRRWKLIHVGTLLYSQVGVKGDGTDDLPALNDGMAILNGATAGIYVFKHDAGLTVNISDTVNPLVRSFRTITGENEGVSRIHMLSTAGTNGTFFVVGTDTISVRDVQINNIGFLNDNDTTLDGTEHAIWWRNCQIVNHEGCTFTNVAGIWRFGGEHDELDDYGNTIEVRENVGKIRISNWSAVTHPKGSIALIEVRALTNCQIIGGTIGGQQYGAPADTRVLRIKPNATGCDHFKMTGGFTCNMKLAGMDHAMELDCSEGGIANSSLVSGVMDGGRIATVKIKVAGDLADNRRIVGFRWDDMRMSADVGGGTFYVDHGEDNRLHGFIADACTLFPYGGRVLNHVRSGGALRDQCQITVNACSILDSHELSGDYDAPGEVITRSIGNITLFGEQDCDGVHVGALGAPTQVFVGEQTDATENGLYIPNPGQWLRSQKLGQIATLWAAGQTISVIGSGRYSIDPSNGAMRYYVSTNTGTTGITTPTGTGTPNDGTVAWQYICNYPGTNDWDSQVTKCRFRLTGGDTLNGLGTRDFICTATSNYPVGSGVKDFGITDITFADADFNINAFETQGVDLVVTNNIFGIGTEARHCFFVYGLAFNDSQAGNVIFSHNHCALLTGPYPVYVSALSPAGLWDTHIEGNTGKPQGPIRMASTSDDTPTTIGSQALEYDGIYTLLAQISGHADDLTTATFNLVGEVQMSSGTVTKLWSDVDPLFRVDPAWPDPILDVSGTSPLLQVQGPPTPTGIIWNLSRFSLEFSRL